MNKFPDKTVWKDHASMCLASAHFFVAACHQAIATQKKFTVALSGGNTPEKLYELLATPEFSRNIPWRNVYLFWSDERFVPHKSPDSNYNLVKKTLLDHIDIPAKNVFPVPITGNPEQSARQYEATIKKYFANKQPVFDWILLGTGNDGHTASLFPNTPILIENRKLVKQVWLEKQQSWRISFTYPLINKAKQIIVLVSGLEKVQVVNAVFTKRAKKIYPVQYISPQKSLWLIDEAAAGQD